MIIPWLNDTLLSNEENASLIAEAIAEIHPAFNGGTAPENVTAPIRRAAPSLLLIIDAAAKVFPAGSIRIIPRRRSMLQASAPICSRSHT